MHAWLLSDRSGEHAQRRLRIRGYMMTVPNRAENFQREYSIIN